MSKKINDKLQFVSIEKNCLSKLNENIEKFVKNTKVFVFVDFFAYQKYKKTLEEIGRCSLNDMKIIVTKANENFEKFDSLIKETNHLVVGIGENLVLKKVRDFAIKNNTNYAFVCENGLKSDIFIKKTQNFEYFPPYFVMVEERRLTKNEKFLCLLDLLKYSYILLEQKLDYENFDLKNFCVDYLKLFNFDCDENLYSKICKLGKLLQKYDIKRSLTNFSCEFENYIYSYYFVLMYKNIFLTLNRYNLSKTRVKNLKITQKMCKNYENFDFKYHKFFLISLKNKFLCDCENIVKFYGEQIMFLEQNFNREFYNFAKFLQPFCLEKYDFCQTFLEKMKNFEIFNKFYQN